MTTEDDLEAAQDAGIESMTTHALLVEAVRTGRRTERRTTVIAEDQLKGQSSLRKLAERVDVLEEESARRRRVGSSHEAEKEAAFAAALKALNDSREDQIAERNRNKRASKILAFQQTIAVVLVIAWIVFRTLFAGGH